MRPSARETYRLNAKPPMALPKRDGGSEVRWDDVAFRLSPVCCYCCRPACVLWQSGLEGCWPVMCLVFLMFCIFISKKILLKILNGVYDLICTNRPTIYFLVLSKIFLAISLFYYIQKFKNNLILWFPHETQQNRDGPEMAGRRSITKVKRGKKCRL